MRTLIDLPERQIDELTKLSKAKKVSRAEIIRQAIAAYLTANKPSADQAFGLWGQRSTDGMEYQEKVRSEW